ncbi:MFS transporter [Candidatus Woesearchaeota archaeon]|nr:MFS transporter [Candidatus Woesearchaeota archaeon]
MNKTIKLLILSDIFVLTGFGLIEPILAIFVKENLVGGTIFAAGIASMIFIITKSIVQMPFAKFMDAQKHKVRWLVVGTFLVALVPFIYMFADHIYTIYAAQFIYGIAGALAFPTWLSLFSTNLDRGHEGFEWSIYSSLTGLGTAASAAIGAAIAEFIGFRYTFVMVGILSVIGCLVLLLLNWKQKSEKIRTLDYYFQTKVTEKD